MPILVSPLSGAMAGIIGGMAFSFSTSLCELYSVRLFVAVVACV